MALGKVRERLACTMLSVPNKSFQSLRIISVKKPLSSGRRFIGLITRPINTVVHKLLFWFLISVEYLIMIAVSGGGAPAILLLLNSRLHEV